MDTEFYKKSTLIACVQNGCSLDFILQEMDIKSIMKLINTIRVFTPYSDITIKNIKTEIKKRFPINTYPEMYI